MFDEMAICQHLEYNGQNYHGHVDMGEDITSADMIMT